MFLPFVGGNMENVNGPREIGLKSMRTNKMEPGVKVRPVCPSGIFGTSTDIQAYTQIHPRPPCTLGSRI